MKIQCPNCGWSRELPASALGKKGECPDCGYVFELGTTHRSKEANSHSTQSEGQQQTVADSGTSEIGWAISSLVSGLLSLLSFWLVIPGIVLGICAITFYALQRRKTPHGLATGGLVLGILALILSGSFGGCMGIYFLGISSVRNAPPPAERVVGREKVEGDTTTTRGQKEPGVKGALHEGESDDPKHDEKHSEKEEYLQHVELQNVRVGESVLGEKGVFGEIKNTGGRTLKEVQIIVYCLDEAGNPVYEDEFYPVMVTESAFTIGERKHLKPNYSQKFGYSLKDAPSDWSGRV